MANLPGDPLASQAAAANPNTDLPPVSFPDLLRILVTDLVGPYAANRQPVSLEQRTESLRTKVNQLITITNTLDTWFLRKNGTQQKDTLTGMTGVLQMGPGGGPNLGGGTGTNPLSASPNFGEVNVNKIIYCANGSVAQYSKEVVNGGQLWALIQLIHDFDPTPLYPRNGERVMTADVQFGGFRGIHVAAGDMTQLNPADGHAVNTYQLQTEINRAQAAEAAETAARIAGDLLLLDRRGDGIQGSRENRMSGNLDMNGHTVFDLPVATPSIASNGSTNHWAASKAYVDDAIQRFCPYNNLGRVYMAIHTGASIVVPNSDADWDDDPYLQIGIDPSAYAISGGWYVLESHFMFTGKIATRVIFTGGYDVVGVHAQQFNHADGEGLGIRGFRSGVGSQGAAGPDPGLGAVDGPNPALPGQANFGVSLIGNVFSNVGTDGPGGTANSDGYMDPICGAKKQAQKASIAIYNGAFHITSGGVVKLQVQPHADRGPNVGRLLRGSWMRITQLLDGARY